MAALFLAISVGIKRVSGKGAAAAEDVSSAGQFVPSGTLFARDSKSKPAQSGCDFFVADLRVAVKSQPRDQKALPSAIGQGFPVRYAARG